MRVRDHIVLSGAGAVLLCPWLGRRVVGLSLAGVLLDVDHFLWYCARQRRLAPRAAIRFFNAADPPQHAATRVLHSPALVLCTLLLGARRRRILPIALGMGLHVALDVGHEARMDRVRAAALRRDGFSCRACGRRGAGVGTHLRRQPRLLPSYNLHNMTSLCGPCHEAAHATTTGATA